jgi:CubicO group peptidase (beta-lactamase class C family)
MADFVGHTGFPGTVLALLPSHDCVAVLLTNRLHVQGLPVPTEELWRPLMSAVHRALHG